MLNKRTTRLVLQLLLSCTTALALGACGGTKPDEPKPEPPTPEVPDKPDKPDTPEKPEKPDPDKPDPDKPDPDKPEKPEKPLAPAEVAKEQQIASMEMFQVFVSSNKAPSSHAKFTCSYDDKDRLSGIEFFLSKRPGKVMKYNLRYGDNKFELILFMNSKIYHLGDVIYDESGRMTEFCERTVSYDEDGHIHAIKNRDGTEDTYTWDGDNLTGLSTYVVDNPSGSDSKATLQKWTLTYGQKKNTLGLFLRKFDRADPLDLCTDVIIRPLMGKAPAYLPETMSGNYTADKSARFVLRYELDAKGRPTSIDKLFTDASGKPTEGVRLAIKYVVE